VETDKVTIDIRSPVDGKLLGVLVKQDDTVVPGQLIFTIDESAAPGGIGSPLPAAAPAPAASTSSAPPPPAAAASGGAAASGHDRAHRPSIAFPPRRTADGAQISSMPEQQAHAALARLAGAQPSAAAAPSPASPAPHAAAAGAAASRAGGAPAAAGRGTTSVTHLSETPARRELTEEEVERIMLGGAAP
jgi:2-oxoglutarate dehydrogenase E2 component (dihydrolipoamide succinyltransferase)